MKFKFNPLPKLNVEQMIIILLLLTLIVVGAALGADYQDLWPKEEASGTDEVKTGVFGREERGEMGRNVEVVWRG
jgi:H+/Cl- antiporter ClcA